jgi:DNA polymerase III gamma/tau subunit
MSEETKKCQTCDMEKPISDYAKRGKGVSTACKDCVKRKGAATREKKKEDAERSKARNALNDHWKQTAEQIDTYDLTQLSNIIKEYQKQIKNMQQLE